MCHGLFQTNVGLFPVLAKIRPRRPTVLAAMCVTLPVESATFFVPVHSPPGSPHLRRITLSLPPRLAIYHPSTFHSSPDLKRSLPVSQILTQFSLSGSI